MKQATQDSRKTLARSSLGALVTAQVAARRQYAFHDEIDTVIEKEYKSRRTAAQPGMAGVTFFRLGSQ